MCAVGSSKQAAGMVAEMVVCDDWFAELTGIDPHTMGHQIKFDLARVTKQQALNSVFGVYCVAALLLCMYKYLWTHFV